MANNIKILLHFSETDIQTMNKKEIGTLLFSVIKHCGSMQNELQVLNKINKQLSAVEEIKSGTNDISKNLTSLSKRIQELEIAKKKVDNSDLSRKLEELDQRLRDSISEISKAQLFQQRFLEELDAKSRKNNLIIMGVAEDETDSVLGNCDLDKVKSIVQKTGISLNSSNLNIRRLGLGTTRTRPIMLTLDCFETRRAILTNAKKLKEDSVCSNIFIRKDTHPALRFEANRLRIKERNERYKPENNNAEIKYDRKERVLMKDGIIIDRFCPSFP